MTLEEAKAINARVAAGEHVFKYDRPMDPTPAMEILERMIDEDTDFVDITESGGPNEHMQAVMHLEAIAGRVERAIESLRLIHLATVAAAPETLDAKLNQTARHGLMALGVRP